MVRAPAIGSINRCHRETLFPRPASPRLAWERSRRCGQEATMKFVRRNTGSGAQLAVVDASGDLVDLPGERDLIPLLDGRLRELAESALRERATVTPEDDAELLAPLEPPTFRD